jgi:hypothetical protein
MSHPPHQRVAPSGARVSDPRSGGNEDFRQRQPGVSPAVTGDPESDTLLTVSEAPKSAPVERLFPFVLRSRSLLVGRDTLWRSRSKLQFVLITTDLSDKSREQVLKDFAPYPIIQHYTSTDLESHFNVRGAKVLGFAKSKLAQSIYVELKAHRINQPPAGSGTAPAK